jgi:precorrin-3B methylase
LTTLEQMDVAAVDMFAIVIVGNSTSRFQDGFMLTPRGYDIPPTGETP